MLLLGIYPPYSGCKPFHKFRKKDQLYRNKVLHQRRSHREGRHTNENMLGRMLDYTEVHFSVVEYLLE